MFSNLKTTPEFLKLKKSDKEKIYLEELYERNILSTEFNPVLDLLESILHIKIDKIILNITRDKIKWDKYWISFKILKETNLSITENILDTKDYKVINNIFTFYLE